MDNLGIVRTMSAQSQVTYDPLELAILKESLISRCNGAKIAFIGVLLSIGPFLLVLADQVPLSNLAIWGLPVVLFLSLRVMISFWTMQALDSNHDHKLRQFDIMFRISSIAQQFWVGTGMWSVAIYGNELTPYFVTLIVCIYGTGAIVSLVHDYQSVLISIPLLFGQCILFWLLKGSDGIFIIISLATVMFLIMGAARRSEGSLKESITIRFANDELLRQLEEEKDSALKAVKRAEELSRSKSLFMAAASHDLRQPLYAISLLRDTLSMHELPGPAKDVVDQQAQAIDALTHMFDNLLDLSRFDSGDVKPNVEPVFLPDVLTELLIEFQPICEKKGLELEFGEVDEFVLSDFELLSRLVRNLISNAVRYTDRGRVSVTTRHEGPFVRLEVQDTGCGIKPEDLPRAFQEFVQFENPQRDREKGVGLGLSIVERIARLLDHKVNLSSEWGIGTKASVLVQCVDRDAQPTEINVHTQDSSRPLRDDLYVWVVEDDELVREALETHLNQLSIRQDVAANRSDLQRLHAEHGWPDFAMLDDMLGEEETGLEIAEWLVSNVPRENILLVTGNAETSRWRTLKNSGFQVLRKPVSFDDLMKWLSKEF